MIGIEFTGSISIKHMDETLKSYIAVFTCTVTCAVHFELITYLSTDKFYFAPFFYFSSRRNACKNTYSDNATAFKASSKDLKCFFSIIKGEEF